MKCWEYLYCYSRDEQYTEVEVYEQPWWARLRADLYHRYICMRTRSPVADMRCFDYDHARRKVVHTFRCDSVTPP